MRDTALHQQTKVAWCILCFLTHEWFTFVIHHAVHLNNGHRKYFMEENIIKMSDNLPKTTIMHFYDMCKVDAFARTPV